MMTCMSPKMAMKDEEDYSVSCCDLPAASILAGMPEVWLSRIRGRLWEQGRHSNSRTVWQQDRIH